eukprot:9485449-Pyramimonas_sp.AAC.1
MMPSSLPAPAPPGSDRGAARPCPQPADRDSFEADGAAAADLFSRSSRGPPGSLLCESPWLERSPSALRRFRPSATNRAFVLGSAVDENAEDGGDDDDCGGDDCDDANATAEDDDRDAAFAADEDDDDDDDAGRSDADDADDDDLG